MEKLGVAAGCLGVGFTGAGRDAIAAFGAITENAVATGTQIEAAFKAVCPWPRWLRRPSPPRIGISFGTLVGGLDNANGMVIGYFFGKTHRGSGA